jgi:hypothetical protein
MLVYTAIVHNYYRIRTGEWLHFVQKPFDKMSECFAWKRTLDNATLKNALRQWDCREYREASSVSQHMYVYDKNKNIPPATHKECLSLCFSSTNRISTTTVCGPAIHRAFIHENHLGRMICTNSGKEIEPFLCWTFCRNPCYLRKGLNFHMIQMRANIRTFFSVNPPLCSVLHTVARETSTPQVAASISCNSSTYKSGVSLTVPSKNWTENQIISST